jgi:hypothetical protein
MSQLALVGQRLSPLSADSTGAKGLCIIARHTGQVRTALTVVGGVTDAVDVHAVANPFEHVH